MSSERDGDKSALDVIREKIGFPADRPSSGDEAADDLSQALDCLRLWFAIRTDDGRRRALDCLARIVADERN